MNKLCKYNQNHIDIKQGVRQLFTGLFAYTPYRVGVNGGKKHGLTFTNQCKVETLEYGNITQTRYQYVNTPEECDQYNDVSGCCFKDIAQPLYQTMITQEASDGFIPVSSQIAFPGATTLQMPGSNHEQMKNDSRTKDVLTNIYNGNSNLGINPWWAIQTR